MTDANSVCIVSPIAQRVLDFAEGHWNVRVFVQTPSSSQLKRPEDSTPATECVMVFNGDNGRGCSGVCWDRRGLAESESENRVDVAGEGDVDEGDECDGRLMVMVSVLEFTSGGIAGV